MRFKLLAAALLLTGLCLAFAPTAQAGPVEKVYDSLAPGEACFASTTLVTGKPTCVDLSPFWPGWVDEACFAATVLVTGEPMCIGNPL